MMKLTERPEKIILEILEKAGYEAYFAGGCVRECFSGETAGAGDIDIATNALPEEVKKTFGGWKTVDTGIAHGTVTVIMPEDRGRAEITTYRSDGVYGDCRHPDKVEFIGSLKEDLRRRDFTMNAMAMDIRGRLEDPFGGRDDIKGKTVRAVGDAGERFREDGLRIMRAVRFSSVLGFSLEEKTERAAFENRKLLSRISAERLFSEFRKTVTGKDAGKAVRKYTDIIGVFMPELEAMKGFDQRSRYHRYDVLEHCIRAMEAVETTEKNREYMKLAALLHDIGKPQTYCHEDLGRGHFQGHGEKGGEMVKILLRRMKADAFTTERVSLLVRNHDLMFHRNERLIKQLMRKFTPGILLEILAVKKADNIATGNASGPLLEKFDEVGRMIEEITAGGDCYSLDQMALKGDDIKALGVKEGPLVGRLLEELLEKVIDGELPNEKSSLTEAAQGLYKALKQ